MSNINIRLTVLKALGIITVVSCHLGVNLFDLLCIPLSFGKELFPEYSFHMPLFIFASGYFYKTLHESYLIEYIKKKFISIKKYMSCNIFYFLLCLIFVGTGFLNRDIDFSIKSLFVEPFFGGFQFYFNGPGWFVPYLFVIQILYTSVRKIVFNQDKIFKKDDKPLLKSESIFLIVLIMLGIVSTTVSSLYPVLDDKVTLLHFRLRILFGLQFFHLGYFYKTFLEDKIKYTLKSFLIIIGLKVIILNLFNNYTFSMRTLSFNNSVFLPLIVSILGLLYILHLSDFIVNKLMKKDSIVYKTIYLIGTNTWSIMMHHLLIKWLLLKLYNSNILPEYWCSIGKYFISPILCIALPICFALLYNKVKDKYLLKDSKKAISA